MRIGELWGCISNRVVDGFGEVAHALLYVVVLERLTVLYRFVVFEVESGWRCVADLEDAGEKGVS